MTIAFTHPSTLPLTNIDSFAQFPIQVASHSAPTTAAQDHPLDSLRQDQDPHNHHPITLNSRPSFAALAAHPIIPTTLTPPIPHSAPPDHSPGPHKLSSSASSLARLPAAPASSPPPLPAPQPVAPLHALCSPPLAAPFPSPSGTFLPPPHVGGSWALPSLEHRRRTKMTTLVRPLSTGILPALALETRVPLQKRRSAPHPAVPPSRPASTSMAALASSQSGLGQSLRRRLSRSPLGTALTVRDFGFPPADPRHFGRAPPPSPATMPASPRTPLVSVEAAIDATAEAGPEDETGALHVALYDFAAEGESEMDLVEGELVRVLEVICDGWVVARKVRGELDEESGQFDEDMVWLGSTGLCPQNYLMKI